MSTYKIALSISLDAGVGNIGFSGGQCRSSFVTTAQLLLSFREPASIRSSVGPKCFVGALVFVVKECSTQSQVSRAWIVCKACRIARAHLEKHPSRKFLQAFAPKESIRVIESVHMRDDMDAMHRSIRVNALEVRGWIAFSFLERNAELIVRPQRFKSR